jgi:DnaJ-class molecular chaperone
VRLRAPGFPCPARQPSRDDPRPMDEKLPVPCEHCHGTGIQAGLECRECGGRGHRVVVAGKLQPNRQRSQPRQQPQRWRRAGIA